MTGIKKRMRISPLLRSLRELIFGINSFSSTPFKSIIRNMNELNISQVVDIGANVGQFGIDIRRSGFKGKIFSFEPVKESFLVLTKTSKRHEPWDAFQLGLGQFEFKQNISVSGNDGLSSSLLPMSKVHLKNFPDSKIISTQEISVSTVDKQLADLSIDPKKILIKLDVQGYESEVLKGAVKSLSNIPLCFLEVSIIPLYEGEITLLPILNLLSESGHEVIDVFRGVKTKNGELLQLDILTKLAVKKSD